MSRELSLSAPAAVRRLMALLAIPGQSCQEGAVIEHLRKELGELGIPESQILVDQAHRKSPLGGETGNLIVKIPGTIRAPRRMLMGHVDTVPLCVGTRPIRKGDWIVPRDAHTALGGDNRAGAAVVLTALAEIVRQQLDHPPLTFFWPVQEEIGLVGARYAKPSQLGNPKLCFNWDGREPNLATIGATGGYDIAIEIHGIASHAGGHPELGVNAIGIASLAIADLIQIGWHGLVIKGEKTGTSNIGIIHAGDATNVVTPSASIRAEARSHDPAFRAQIVKAIRTAFTKAADQLKTSDNRRGSIEFTETLKYESFRISESEPSVQAALAAVRKAGLEPDTRISNGGLDANWTTANGLPTVTLGCGQNDIHTVNEKLNVNDYLAACRIGLTLATASE